MARVRLSNEKEAERQAPPDPAANHPGRTAETATFRGLSERQWFISLLVAAGLLLLITFRGCIVPTGIGPKSKPAAQPGASAPPTVQPNPGGEYTVVAGDTLSSIAKKKGTTLEALAGANNIDLNKPVILRVGQTLKIPGA